MNLSGHFLANYINIFHKIELQTIILICLTCLNLIWIKSYNIIFFISCFLQFCEKNTENLWFINGHLGIISGQFLANYMKIFHKKEILTVILRCLVGLNLNWIKSYDIILVEMIFYHAWKCIILWLVCQSEFWHLLKKLALIFSKWLFFQDSFGLSWNTYSGKIQVKASCCFLNFSLIQYWIYFFYASHYTLLIITVPF